jgi:hypothetical protein
LGAGRARRVGRLVDPDSLCDSVVIAPRSGAFLAEHRTCVADGAEVRGAVTVVFPERCASDRSRTLERAKGDLDSCLRIG